MMNEVIGSYEQREGLQMLPNYDALRDRSMDSWDDGDEMGSLEAVERSDELDEALQYIVLLMFNTLHSQMEQPALHGRM